jgi:hypothetical protein
VIVPVPVVLRVPVAVVHVVDVALVLDGLVPTPLTVGVVVAGVFGVFRGAALVPVPGVLRVQVPVVHVVGVVAVRERRVPAALAVGVLVIEVFGVGGGHGNSFVPFMLVAWRGDHKSPRQVPGALVGTL